MFRTTSHLLLSDCLTAVGHIKYVKISDEKELTAIQKVCDNIEGSVMQYNKARVNGELVYAQGAPRVKRTNDYTVAYFSNSDHSHVKYGYVAKLITVESSTSNHLAIIHPLNVQPAKLCHSLIDRRISQFKQSIQCDFLSFTTTNEVEAIHTTNIVTKLCNVQNSAASLLTKLLTKTVNHS